MSQDLRTRLYKSYAALRCLARRPAALERRMKKLRRAYRLQDAVSRPVGKALKELCLIEKNGYGACYVRSSSSPVVMALRDDGNLKLTVKVGARPRYSSAKLSSDQIKTSSTRYNFATFSLHDGSSTFLLGRWRTTCTCSSVYLDSNTELRFNVSEAAACADFLVASLITPPNPGLGQTVAFS
jgi:hypothetical protein